MSQRHHRARFLVAALAALLTGNFVGAAGLVFCLGTDGHRALELEHPGMECPTLAGSPDTRGISVRLPAECLDIPTAGAGPATLSSVDPDRMPTPPVSWLISSPEAVPLVATRLPVSIGPRAGPLDLSRHLRTTVLLV